MENWRAVERFPLYEVSDLGRVKSAQRDRFGNLCAKSGGLLKPSLSLSGYLMVKLRHDGLMERRSVHSLVAEAFLGPRPEGFVVMHLDDVSFHNRVQNLRYGTAAENREMAARSLGSSTAKRSRCAYGHPLVEGNVAGFRRKVCRACFETYDPTTGFDHAAADLAFLENAVRAFR